MAVLMQHWIGTNTINHTTRYNFGKPLNVTLNLTILLHFKFGSIKTLRLMDKIEKCLLHTRDCPIYDTITDSHIYKQDMNNLHNWWPSVSRSTLLNLSVARVASYRLERFERKYSSGILNLVDVTTCSWQEGRGATQNRECKKRLLFDLVVRLWTITSRKTKNNKTKNIYLLPCCVFFPLNRKGTSTNPHLQTISSLHYREAMHIFQIWLTVMIPTIGM